LRETKIQTEYFRLAYLFSKKIKLKSTCCSTGCFPKSVVLVSVEHRDYIVTVIFRVNDTVKQLNVLQQDKTVILTMAYIEIKK